MARVSSEERRKLDYHFGERNNQKLYRFTHKGYSLYFSSRNTGNHRSRCHEGKSASNWLHAQRSTSQYDKHIRSPRWISCKYSMSIGLQVYGVPIVTIAKENDVVCLIVDTGSISNIISSEAVIHGNFNYSLLEKQELLNFLGKDEIVEKSSWTTTLSV